MLNIIGSFCSQFSIFSKSSILDDSISEQVNERMAMEAGVTERVNYYLVKTLEQLVKGIRVTTSPELELHVFYTSSVNVMY